MILTSRRVYGVLNGKGFLLASWAAERDIRIINSGEIPTCMRPQNISIVDTTWSSPDLLSFIRNWKVLSEIDYRFRIIATSGSNLAVTAFIHHYLGLKCGVGT